MSEHQYRGRPSGRRPQSRPNRRVSQNGGMNANTSNQQGNRRNSNNRHNGRSQDSNNKKKPISFWKKLLGLFGIGKKPQTKPTAQKTGNTPVKTNTRVARTQESRPRKAPKMPVDSPRLYVGNLSYEASESDIEDLFKGIGSVDSVEIIYNPRTHKSKGYGFVGMRNMDDALRAVEVLHEQPFMGRNLTVSAANERDMNNNGEERETGKASRYSEEESESDVVVEETVTPLVADESESTHQGNRS